MNCDSSIKCGKKQSNEECGIFEPSYECAEIGLAVIVVKRLEVVAYQFWYYECIGISVNKNGNPAFDKP